ncbi:prolyl 4-hydroxylase subunit alpha-1-like isoform X2 [Artemia franciscana]|uniref:prolyl 4-hydroxylase subunit alpha-1-like isoform X2 n=1 Tax=Artemia franciscana TaxID=6661 RepID=UPI0032DAF7E4
MSFQYELSNLDCLSTLVERKNKMLFWVALYSVLRIFMNYAKAEVFTALVDMEPLIDTESELIQQLNKYIGVEEERLNRLKKYFNEYSDLHKEASQDTTKYLENPINAYLLVKRLTADWKEVESTMLQNQASVIVKNITEFRNVLRFPSEEDLTGAAVALTRLQDTYKLDTKDLARGEILGKRYTRSLTAGDCFELGRQTYNSKDYYHTILWMTEAMSILKEEVYKTTSESEILEYLAFSIYMQGNIHQALHYTNELLRLVPYHQRALGNKKFYEDTLKKQGAYPPRGDPGVEGLVPADEMAITNELRKPQDPYPERNIYEALCRGEKVMSPGTEAKLKCYYFDNGSPFLKIQPVKAEDAFLDPKITVFHEVLSDSEIERIKEMAKPRFQRATVQDHATGNLVPASYRISKSAWLKSEEDQHVFKVARRVGDITGLDMDTAEELQVVNYGIGGHYEPHFDHARKDEIKAFKSLGTGNRIATWLFYMSDVEAGGATVFPNIGVSLWPRKGSAAFWYNLHPNGEGNENTRHAACPVLTGSKWVSNKWIHELGQEFRKPCKLGFDDRW